MYHKIYVPNGVEVDLARNSDFLPDNRNYLWDNRLQRQLLSRPVPGFARKVWEVLKLKDTDRFNRLLHAQIGGNFADNRF